MHSALYIKYWIINDIKIRLNQPKNQSGFFKTDQSILRDYIFINEPKHAMNLFPIIIQSCLDQLQVKYM